MSVSYSESQIKAARDALFAGAKMAQPVPEVHESEFPDILEASSKKYSDVFPEYYKSGMMKDFAIPDIAEIPEWAEKYIPEKSDYLGETMTVYNAVMAYALKSVTRFTGPPGTGKSEGLPVFIAHRLGLPIIRLGLNNKQLAWSDLIGQSGISNEGGVPVTHHQDGMLIKWVGIPAIIVADEFCRSTPDINNGFMPLLERNGKLLIENRALGGVIHRHPDCWVIATDNVKGTGDTGVGMVGTDQVDGAVLDRFEETIELGYLSADNSVKLLCNKIVGFPKAHAEVLAKFAKRVQTAYMDGRLPLSFSHRSMFAIARKSCVSKDLDGAVKVVFLQKFDADDKTFVAQMWKDTTGRDL